MYYIFRYHLCCYYYIFVIIYAASITFSFSVNLFCYQVGMQVDIPKGYSSEKFLSWRVIIPKIFIPKGHYSEDFYAEGSLFRNSE